MLKSNLVARAGGGARGAPAAHITVASLRLSSWEEAVLRAYFGCDLPGVPSQQSNFRAMCSRLASGTRARSAERPTRGTPWTQIVECAGTHGAVNLEGEDAMVAYFDARRRFRQVCSALAELSERDYAVLEAYYGAPPAEHALGPLAEVACLTETARRRNRSRAAREMHEPVEATVRWLAAATAPDSRAAFAQVRGEAVEMLEAARASYRWVRERRREVCGNPTPTQVQ